MTNRVHLKEIKKLKRVTKREESRKGNDLMECFKARAATRKDTTSDVKKKPAAASKGDLKKG